MGDRLHAGIYTRYLVTPSTVHCFLCFFMFLCFTDYLCGSVFSVTFY